MRKISPFIKTYVEEPRVAPRKTHFDDETYLKILDGTIIGNVDCVVVAAEGGMLLLKRQVYPMKGWWWFGGRQHFGELEKEAMPRIFKRETGLQIAPERFQLICATTYLWNMREQEPKSNGSHNRAWTFAVELTREEERNMRIDPNEYTPESVRWFCSRAALVEAGVHQAILDAWDAIFC